MNTKLTYFGITVTLIEWFTHLALVRRLDGLSFIVEVKDLEVMA